MKKNSNTITIQVPWQDPYNEDFMWNELLAWTMETYGLPGDRWTYKPDSDYMLFEFGDENDSLLFQLKTNGKRLNLQDLYLIEREKQFYNTLVSVASKNLSDSIDQDVLETLQWK